MRPLKIDFGLFFDRLAEGKMQKAIAAEIGCSYGHLRTELAKHIKEIGCKTVGQALARHARERLKEQI